MENREIDVLKNLRDKKEISIEQYKDLSPSGSRPGIMYGSVKVHKSSVKWSVLVHLKSQPHAQCF